MMRRLRAVVLAVLLAASVVTAPPASAVAFPSGGTWAYDSYHYGGLLKSWYWQGGDCTSTFGYGFFTGQYVQQRISAVQVNVTGRTHCNMLSVHSAGWNTYAQKCITSVDPGFEFLWYPFDNNTVDISVNWNPNCPLNR